MSIIKCNFTSFLLILFAFSLGCTTPKSTTPSEKEGDLDKKKIIVLLERGVKPKALEYEFKTYELKAKRPASRSENRFMFSFNPDLIEADDLLAKIEASDKVISCKFPKIVRTPRVTN